MAPAPRSVALVTLGCARNEVDSSELAGRLADGGFALVEDPGDAETVLVNTCGFVAEAKKDSVDTLLAAADLKSPDGPQAVVAVGCLAERYGAELAGALPEADAVLGFDDYPDVAARVAAVLAGDTPAPPEPRDRRRLLPLTPVDRAAGAGATPGHAGVAAPLTAPSGAPAGTQAPDLPDGVAPASGPRVVRRLLQGGPVAPLKLASGCDRRCSFCAIPSFRGAFVSRPPSDVLAEARWLAAQGVREVLLVSENSTSYGKDLGDLRLLESLLPALAAVDGLDRVRLSYLQPAEIRPGLLDVMTATEGVVPYFDVSFQHASPAVLRRMRRFGGTDRFCALVDEIRARAPRAGIRSNVIVGFPGETEADLAELEAFLTEARLDVVGVFGYSAEDGTEAAGLDGTLDETEVATRVARVATLVEQLTAQRAEERVGEAVEVLVEDVDGETGEAEGRAAHQAPEVDGLTVLRPLVPGTRPPGVGTLVRGKVTDSRGVDLVATCDTAEPEDEP